MSIITVDKSGAKLARTFRPDFSLVRQHVCEARVDFRDILLGLKFGGVPAVNSLNGVYNFQDRPWVVSFNLYSIIFCFSVFIYI